MSESDRERYERPVARLDKAQIDALLATVMKEMDKNLEFAGVNSSANNVLGSSSQARRAAREKRKGKRPARVEEPENLDSSSGRSTDEERSDELKELDGSKKDDGAARPKHTLDRPTEIVSSSNHSEQIQDPFFFSKGPVTRSQTKNLKKAILTLVYSNPEPISIENQVNQMFNHSVIKAT
ncbi:hypothetical protein F2Q69_00013072 [Brassica cretica]|uniref:Uncharacterized protein n=1 Tax=Brassica cretica TaxID=69181 RepID=A0A8S9QJR1_BRACR|nr:hypothetical protein F2Q69_00013072 [Brassica cretica]